MTGYVLYMSTDKEQKKLWNEKKKKQNQKLGKETSGKEDTGSLTFQ